MMALRQGLLGLGRNIDLLQRWLRFRLSASALNPWRIPPLNSDMFRGKRVVILGPARTLFDDLEDLVVDSFDVIVRLNNGIALALECDGRLGSRTDVLFHNLNEQGQRSAGSIPPALLLAHKVQYCVFPHWGFKGSKARLFEKKAELSAYPQVSLAVPSVRFCEKLRRKLHGHQPTIGTSAILFFLECDVRELQLHGFTFFQTPYVEGYNDTVKTSKDAREWVAASKVHDPAQEKRVILHEVAQALERGVKVVLGKNVAHHLYEETDLSEMDHD